MSADHLNQKGIENPRLNAEVLLAHVLKRKRIDLYLDFDRPLTPPEVEAYRTCLKRRLKHEPLQHITGVTEFMSLPFKVDRSVLVPRPETEILVEKVLDAAQQFSGVEPFRILDVGTGSGNIAISLAKNLSHAQITAIDISASALAVAAENAQLNQVESQIQFQVADCKQFLPDKSFDILVSNPPYIRETEFKALPPEVKFYDPKQALLASENGLEYYRILAERVPLLLKKDRLIAVEIGYQQGKAVSSLFQTHHFQNIQTIPDLNQHDRVVLGIWTGEKNEYT